MNDFDIKAFLTLVEKRSFSAAAETLSMTQSALSQRIRMLEEELSYPLFIRQRGHRQIALTSEGEKFSFYARQIQRLIEASFELGKEKRQEAITISVIESVMSYSMPSLFRTFMQRYPDIRLTLTSYYSQEAYQLIDEGKLDLAIVGKLRVKPNSHVYITPLYSDSWYFVCSKDADYPVQVDPRQLDPTQQILMFTNEKSDWPNSGLPDPGLAKFIGDTSSFYSNSMFSGNSWAIIPCSIAQTLKARDFCDIRPLTMSLPARTIYAITNGSPENDHIHKLLTCIRDELSQNPSIQLLLPSADSSTKNEIS